MKKLQKKIAKNNINYSDKSVAYNSDYCCNEVSSVNFYNTGKNVNSDEIIKRSHTIYKGKINEEDIKNIELDQLIDYILFNHHNYIIKKLPLISKYSVIVYKEFKINHKELFKIKSFWNEINLELSNHLLKEERMLFPYIKNLVIIKNNFLEFQYAPFGTITNPINVMEKEHHNVIYAFCKIRELSNNYKIQNGICETFVKFYGELKEFEIDLNKHIHIENNILHPKAIELEKKLLNNK